MTHKPKSKSARQLVEERILIREGVHALRWLQLIDTETSTNVVNDCGKEPCQHNRICRKTGDCPEEEA
ncbi:MAG: hypothetical protein AAB362_00540 [Patescibacteria group bacterium]